jgi:hypothetical protein
MCAKSCDHNSQAFLMVICDVVMNFEREVSKRLLGRLLHKKVVRLV